jgi:hypothetical protein
MQIADVALAQRRGVAREFAHIMQRIEMVEGFEMVLERLAPDGEPLLQDDRGLLAGQRVPFDGV